MDRLLTWASHAMISAETNTGTSRTVIYFCIATACLIAFLSFGVRASLGIFLKPMIEARGWSSETFGFAIALQHLFWGIAQPFAGALADSRGYVRIFAGGTLLYIVGLLSMSMAESVWLLYLGGGVVAGLGLAGVSWTISVGAVARIAPAHMQGSATGLIIAFCSIGQLVLSVLGEFFISAYGWQAALWIMTALVALIAPLAFPFAKSADSPRAAVRSSLSETLAAALSNRNFWMVFAGFFICGVHTGFILTHLPAHVGCLGLPPQTGALALAAIGLANLFSSYGVGVLGQTYSKKNILACVYGARTVVMLALLLVPPADWNILLVSAVLGIFWMSSVPPTSGLIGQIFGSRYLSTLLGVVFLGHQIGAFLGAWMGGVVFDRTLSYEPMWWLCILLSALAALIVVPVDGRPVTVIRKHVLASAA
jgi:predicted MFS family arabinose efflux permease